MADLLDSARIATPCRANWDDMRGDDRVRFCALCKFNVYDFSNMAREEAIALVRRTEGRLCATLWRRQDGTVITADCPVGLAARARRRLSVLAAALATLVTVSLAGNAFAQSRTGRDLIRTVAGLVEATPTVPPANTGFTRGIVAIPQRPR